MKATLFILGQDPKEFDITDIKFPKRVNGEVLTLAAKHLDFGPEDIVAVNHEDEEVLIFSQGEEGAEINRAAVEKAKDVADTLDGRGHWDREPIWGNCLIIERK